MAKNGRGGWRVDWDGGESEVDAVERGVSDEHIGARRAHLKSSRSLRYAMTPFSPAEWSMELAGARAELDVMDSPATGEASSCRNE